MIYLPIYLYWRPIGYDLRKGKIVIEKFTRIGPEEIGVLVASGRKEVIVSSKLSIGVLSIGNNLQEPGEPLKPGYVYDINRISLISLLKYNSFSSLDFGIVNNKWGHLKFIVTSNMQLIILLYFSYNLQIIIKILSFIIL